MSTTILTPREQVDRWNYDHGVGTEVVYTRQGEPPTRSRTTSKAWLLSGFACVKVEGWGGAALLKDVEVVEREVVGWTPAAFEPIVGVCNHGNWNAELTAYVAGDSVGLQFGDEDEDMNADFCMPAEGARELARRLLVLADEVDAAAGPRG